MPNYSYRCEAGCEFEASYAMSDVPQRTECRACGGAATRRITAPFLSQRGSSAYGLIDDAARSAHEPAVVSTLPRKPGAASRRITQNPLHAKLPRA